MNTTLTPKDEMRLLPGFLAQPFVAAALAFVTFPLMDLSGRAMYGGAPAEPMDAAVALALGTGVAALVVTLLGAWPAALWVIKRRAVTLTDTLRFGLLLANIPVALMTLATGGGYGLAGFVRAIVFASLLGLTGAAAFWAISTPRGLSDHEPSADADGGKGCRRAGGEVMAEGVADAVAPNRLVPKRKRDDS